MEQCERPWGKWFVLDEGPGFKVKKLVVNPKGELSKQVHQHRSEIWIVVKGRGHLIFQPSEMIEEHYWDLQEGQHFVIPRLCIHKLSNPYNDELVIIEIQRGEILSEEDIERLDEKRDPIEQLIEELRKDEESHKDGIKVRK